MDKARNIRKRLMEFEEQIEDFKRQKQELIEELKKEEIDLVKDKKIQWVNLTFEEWYKSDRDTFWIYQTDCETRFGIWDGREKLNRKQIEHFGQFEIDYFYYGTPVYDAEEAKESDLAVENGNARVIRIKRNDL